MGQLSRALHIAATPEVVFDIVADPDRQPDWLPMVERVVERAGRTGGIGSSYSAVYRIAGQRLLARFVVTAVDRPSLIEATGVTPGGWARVRFRLAPAGGGTDVLADVDYALPNDVLGGIVGLVARGLLARGFRRMAVNLRALAEDEPRDRPVPLGPRPAVPRPSVMDGSSGRIAVPQRAAGPRAAERPRPVAAGGTRDRSPIDP